MKMLVILVVNRSGIFHRSLRINCMEPPLCFVLYQSSESMVTKSIIYHVFEVPISLRWISVRHRGFVEDNK